MEKDCKSLRSQEPVPRAEGGSGRAGEGCRAAAAALCLCVRAAGAGPGPALASPVRVRVPRGARVPARREGTEAPLCAALPLPLSERHLCERSPSGLSIERLECETSIVTPWEPDATDPPPPAPVCAPRSRRTAPRRAEPCGAEPSRAEPSRAERSRAPPGRAQPRTAGEAAAPPAAGQGERPPRGCPPAAARRVAPKAD